jgi:hypothetical protein
MRQGISVKFPKWIQIIKNVSPGLKLPPKVMMAPIKPKFRSVLQNSIIQIFQEQIVALVEILCCLPYHLKPTRGEGGEWKRKSLTLNKSHHFQHYFGRATLVIHIVTPTVILDGTLLCDLQKQNFE